MIHLDVDRQFSDQVSEDLLRRAGRAALQVCRADPSSSLTIVVTDDHRMKELNSRFRQVDQTTDVLAFPADFIDPDTDAPYLGDVVISYPQAASQAEVGGHQVEDELQLLTVHGVLHLLGYDHLDPEEKAAMWGLQDQVLNALNLDLSMEEDSI